MYLLEREADLQPRYAFDLFYFDYGTDGQSANLFADFLVERKLRIHAWVEWLARANDMLPNADRHKITIAFRDKQAFADESGLLRRFPQQIDLTAEEEELGRSLLEEMGIPRGARFVCFHIREAAYWQNRKEGIDDSSDFRNSNIENYHEAMLSAANRGYYVLRIGAGTSRALPDIHPRIIDYASTHRTEFMDVFLAFRCSLMVSTGSGIDSLSYLSRRPMVLVNLVTWGAAFVGAPQPYICVFKKFWRDRRLMSFEEILKEHAQEYAITKKFQAENIDLEENAPDEIAESVNQMLDRLEGKEVLSAEDGRRQERMREYIARSRRYRKVQFEVSAHFLQKFESLL
jgi:putative glycosyltransferase (TIGR04372 family)